MPAKKVVLLFELYFYIESERFIENRRSWPALRLAQERYEQPKLKTFTMGLFSKIFGNRDKTNKPKNKQNNFLTNSQDYGLGEIELGISGKVRVDGLLAIAAMEKIAKEKNEEFKFSVMHTSLLEEGALTVPVVCTIGAEKYSLYFIYQEEELLKYKDLVKHVQRTAYPKLIYL